MIPPVLALLGSSFPASQALPEGPVVVTVTGAREEIPSRCAPAVIPSRYDDAAIRRWGHSGQLSKPNSPLSLSPRVTAPAIGTSLRHLVSGNCSSFSWFSYSHSAQAHSTLGSRDAT